jgi:hypothetical protein
MSAPDWLQDICMATKIQDKKKTQRHLISAIVSLDVTGSCNMSDDKLLG